MRLADAKKWLDDRPEIQSIFACVCDLNGTLRGKRLPKAQIGKVVEGGVRMPLSVINVDIWGEDIQDSVLVFETGDSDGICEFTGRDLLPIDWTERPSAMAML